MTADYRADLPALARLGEAVASLSADPTWGYLARYWVGFASWRLAINGANRGMSAADLRAHLEHASTEFEACVRLRADFADGHAAAASVSSWLIAFRQDDRAATAALIDRYQRRLARAKALEPDNPRVLWVEAAPYLFMPVGRGGDPGRAIGLYRRMLAVAGPTQPTSPKPDWGQPEAFMSLAYAHLHAAPDLAAAETEARAALRLQPDWSYLEDFLLPEIESARAAGGSTAARRR
jgi:hypothetical protein